MNLLKADSLPCEHEAPALWASVRPLWSSPKFVYWGKVVTLQCSLVFPLKHIKAVLVIKRTYFLTFSRTKRDTSADVLTSAHFFMFLPCRSRGWNPIRSRYFNSVWRWAASANGPRAPDVCRGVGWKKKKAMFWFILISPQSAVQLCLLQSAFMWRSEHNTCIYSFIKIAVTSQSHLGSLCHYFSICFLFLCFWIHI